MNNVLITGGAGFVGSHLTEKLISEGCTVSIVDDLSNGNLENLGENKEKVKFFNFDISKPDWEQISNLKFDTIFHLATHPRSFSLSDPIRNSEVNVNGMINVLEFARKNSSKLVYTSNSGICGDPQYFPVDEKHPIDCKTPYDANKLVGEYYAKIYEKIYGVYTVIFRLATVYGERQRVNEKLGWKPLIATMVEKIVKNQTPQIQWDGNQTRDLIYVKDVVNCLIKGSESNDQGGEMFLLSTNKETSVNDVFDTICNITGNRPNPEYQEKNPGDLRRMILSYEKAKNAFGYEPKYSLEDGVKKYVKWYTSRN